MHHYFEAITNTSGDSLIGYFARVVDPATNNSVTIAADNNGTPISTVSGVDNAAKTDAYGNLDFYVQPGTYHLDIYAPNATSLQLRVQNVAMNSTKGDTGAQGPQGPEGPPGSGTIQTVTGLQDALDQKASAMVPPEPGATGSVSRQLIEYVREIPLSPAMFGAVGNGTSDDTVYLQKMIDYAKASMRQIVLPAKAYKITGSLNIDTALRMQGAGADGAKGTRFINSISNFSNPAINIYVPAGKIVTGLDIGGFNIDTTGTYESGWNAAGCAIRIGTNPGNVVVDSCIHDIIINNHQLGLDASGTIYQTTFERMRVSGNTPMTGLPLGPTIAGFRCIPGNGDFTYNTFETIEVTNTQNGAYAHRLESQFSNFNNVTADGPILISSTGGVVTNCTVEGFTPNVLPSGVNYAMNFTNVRLVAAPGLRAIPPSKVPIGIFMGASGWTLVGAHAYGEKPNTPIYIGGGSGVLAGIFMENVVNKIAASGEGGLNGCIALNCESVTNGNFSYTGDATWSPTFSGWTTAPTIIAARYTRIGNEITVHLVASDGVSADGASIGGLPLTSSSVVGGTASLASSDSSKAASGRIWLNSTVIDNIPARTLTNNFWQLTGVYRV